MCGGTKASTNQCTNTHGLSPRVRGNPREHRLHGGRSGSIPACAGEPPLQTKARQQGPVYPRVCGGTRIARSDLLVYSGLSPRVRGNRRPLIHFADRERSIPACAGEPRIRLGHSAQSEVYPRVCGGTTAPSDVPFSPTGLSPRVRGNPIRPYGSSVKARSIPACAGEPRKIGRYMVKAPVYPRVCGGTRPHRQHQCHSRGLSPRVRGNQYTGTVVVLVPGSIPACAGEPVRWGGTL